MWLQNGIELSTEAEDFRKRQCVVVFLFRSSRLRRTVEEDATMFVNLYGPQILKVLIN